MAQGSSILGSALSSFGSTDYKPINIIKGQSKYAEELQKKQKEDQSFYDTWLDKYNTGVGDVIGRINTERPMARSDLQGIFERERNYDPYAGPERYVGSWFDKISDLAGKIPDWTTKNLDLNAFNMGIGGRPSTSYFAPAISRHIASQLFPTLSTVASSVPGVSSVAEAGRNANIANLMDIIGRRAGTAAMGMDLPLAPIQARLNARNQVSNALQALNQARSTGIAGWKADPDTIAKISDSMNSVAGATKDTVSWALNTLGSLYTGGLLGGMGGGGGGAGGGGGMGGMMGGMRGGGGAGAVDWNKILSTVIANQGGGGGYTPSTIAPANFSSQFGSLNY